MGHEVGCTSHQYRKYVSMVLGTPFQHTSRAIESMYTPKSNLYKFDIISQFLGPQIASYKHILYSTPGC